MNRNRFMRYLSRILLLLCIQKSYADAQKPTLTVIFVIDQFAYHYIPKLSAHFKHGLKFLLDNGVNYHNAYFPHGKPATGTGHPGLSTGAYAKDHGMVANKWINTHTNQKIACDDDDSKDAAILAANNTTYANGKSARNILVDGISDQFVLASRPGQPHYAVSLSLKSRAAIGTAGYLGKAYWFDSKTGLLTTSKAYDTVLPSWLEAFNTSLYIDTKAVDWQLKYAPDSPAY